VSAIIPLIKLILDTGVFSPVAPATVKEAKPPSSKAGMRPDCGIGKKAVLINDNWVCIPSFK